MMQLNESAGWSYNFAKAAGSSHAVATGAKGFVQRSVGIIPAVVLIQIRLHALSMATVTKWIE